MFVVIGQLIENCSNFRVGRYQFFFFRQSDTSTIFTDIRPFSILLLCYSILLLRFGNSVSILIL